MMALPRVVSSEQVFQALTEAGVLNDGPHTRRVVIDLQAGSMPLIYVERFGDEALLNVATTLNGIEVRYGEEIVR